MWVSELYGKQFYLKEKLALLTQLFSMQVRVRFGLVCGMGSCQSDRPGRLLAVLLLLQRGDARAAILPPITAFHNQGVRVNPSPTSSSHPKQRAEDTLDTNPWFFPKKTHQKDCYTHNHLALKYRNICTGHDCAPSFSLSVTK